MERLRSWSLGALGERDYRLLFSSTLVTTLGDAIADIALAFAVLDIGSATGLGVVLAARQGVEALVVVLGAVITDRFPRHFVLVAASLVQATAQGLTAALVLTDNATIASLVVLQALYGLGSGFVWPAEIGLVPQVVSPRRLQQANAFQGLARDGMYVLGPVIGGIMVVAGSPGAALGIDAASFLLCAALLLRIRPRAPEEHAESAGYLQELREGWREFSSRTWLWGAMIGFAISGLAWSSWLVLGPLVSKEELGGAGAWATIVAATGVGAVIGGIVAMRVRPERPLVAAVVVSWALPAEIAALALGLQTWAIAIFSFVGGAALAIHIALWFTVFQQQIPERARSRVSSYDALFTMALVPVGYAVVGPLADAIGVSETLWIAFAIELGSLLAILCIPAVWAIRYLPTATNPG